MTTSAAIIGLGIMGTRRMKHMRLHEESIPDYLWDPNPNARENAIKLDRKCKIMKNAYYSHLSTLMGECLLHATVHACTHEMF